MKICRADLVNVDEMTAQQKTEWLPVNNAVYDLLKDLFRAFENDRDTRSRKYMNYENAIREFRNKGYKI